MADRPIYDTYDDDEESDDQEVERPRTPPRPREIVPQMPNEPVAVPPPPSELPDTRQGQAGRGDSGGSVVSSGGAPLVTPMPDMPPSEEPRLTQAMNDKQVADLFSSQRSAKVIQMRPRKGMGDAPILSVQAPLPVADQKAAIAAQQAQQRAAQAAADAQKATLAANQAAAAAQAAAQQQQRIAVQTATVQQAPTDQQAPEPYRVPVRRRSSPFVLLGVAAAALFGAVAWSMMETYSQPPLGEADEDEDDDEITLDVPPLKGLEEDVIEGEIVTDDEEDEDEKVA